MQLQLNSTLWAIYHLLVISTLIQKYVYVQKCCLHVTLKNTTGVIDWWVGTISRNWQVVRYMFNKNNKQ